jgi:DMSO reductase anchor subunit
MPLKSPVSTVIAFGMTCFLMGFVLLSAALQQQTSVRLLGLLTIAIAIFSAVVLARRILRAVGAGKTVECQRVDTGSVVAAPMTSEA